jgi:hypothetical protein
MGPPSSAHIADCINGKWHGAEALEIDVSTDRVSGIGAAWRY